MSVRIHGALLQHLVEATKGPASDATRYDKSTSEWIHNASSREKVPAVHELVECEAQTVAIAMPNVKRGQIKTGLLEFEN
jgi:hypothetical protein